MNKMFGIKNPQWKGADAGYNAIHSYVRKRFKKPKLCENCKKVSPIDMANISGKYLRELSDWEYLCRKCHMDKDGRNNKLRTSGKDRRISDKKCEICGAIYHRSSGMRKSRYCSLKCRNIGMWQIRPRRKLKKCLICKLEFYPQNKSIVCCSGNCGRKQSWKKRK